LEQELNAFNLEHEDTEVFDEIIDDIVESVEDLIEDFEFRTVSEETKKKISEALKKK
jgi:hypothetical protein